MPKRANKFAGAWDVYARDFVVDNEEGKLTVKLGFKTEIPEGYAMCIIPRSGITKSRFVLGNSLGLIDCDYRGEWMAKFIAIPNIEIEEETNRLKLSLGEFPYKKGERVAQMFLRKLEDFELVEGEVNETERGEGGFNSTGSK